MPGLTGRGHGRAHAADTALGIGHSAGFFAPGGGGQQQIGVFAGDGGGKGFLHDDQLGTLERPAHRGLVRHALGRVGTGDPQGLDFAVGGGLEHFDRSFAGF